jgi:hypothetical protein
MTSKQKMWIGVLGAGVLLLGCCFSVPVSVAIHYYLKSQELQKERENQEAKRDEQDKLEPQREKKKEDQARLAVLLLDEAVQAHKLQVEGDFPQTLQELTIPYDGMPAALNAGDLKDPWGSEYKYEPQNKDSLGRPHIYTKTPSGVMIDNWKR